MQGVYVNGSRPKSKKQVKEAAASDPASVRLEATSVFGNEYDGTLANAPDGTYTFVGPNPHTDRRFYGTVKVSSNGVKVS
jgi:hypothetical protein